MVDNLMRAGYIAGAVTIVWDAFLVITRSDSYGAWDYVLPIALVLIPIVSLIFASVWPLVSGVALIAAGLYVGIPLIAISLNFWVVAIYALPVLITGIPFLLTGIISRRV
jgi:hypothetical protein